MRETVAFANALANVDPHVMGHELLVQAANERTERVLQLLHLETCADTMARVRARARARSSTAADAAAPTAAAGRWATRWCAA